MKAITVLFQQPSDTAKPGISLIDWVKVLRPTRHKIGHFGHLPQVNLKLIPLTFWHYRVLTIFWYWNSRTFQGPWSRIFKDQLSTEVYSMYSITALFNFNIYLCDYGTVLVDKNKTW